MVRAFLILLLLSGCAARLQLAPVPDGAAVSKVVKFFVASNRQFEAGIPGTNRSEGLQFASLEISVPPERETGSITTPGGNAANVKTDFLVSNVDPLQGKAAFSKSLRAELLARKSEDRVAMIFVHGFNYTFSDGVLRMAQLVEDLQIDAVAVHFAWPSAANPLGYERDRGSALFSRDALEDVIRLVKSAGARQVVVVAHSMGAFLTMETLRQMDISAPGSVAKELHGVVLVSPDIDVDVFRRQVSRIEKLPTVFAVFIAKQDRALGLSALLTGEKERLGNLQDSRRIQDLEVTLVDVSNFANDDRMAHFVPGTAPELIDILRRAADVDNAFEIDASGQSGVLPGSVLRIQNVTEFVISPLN